MILVDTSTWLDHLRRGDRQLAMVLEAGEVVCHPFDWAWLSAADRPRCKT